MVILFCSKSWSAALLEQNPASLRYLLIRMDSFCDINTKVDLIEI
jgi:hypothetical protein